MDPEEKSFPASTTTSPSIEAAPSSASRHLPPVSDSRSENAFLQPASSTAINFFSLPSKARQKIYRSVLTMAHPVYLFQDPGSPVETFAPERPPRWLALIHTNRQMNREASAVLYGVNNFTLVDTTQQQVGLLQAFLDCIGPVNASLLSQMCINFPVMEFQMEECKLREDDLQSLKLLQEKCTNLSILETYIHNNNSKGLTRMHEGNLQPILEALSQFDVQLKAIPSLEKVIVRVHDGAPIPSVMRSMQGLGWIVLPGTGNKW